MTSKLAESRDELIQYIKERNQYVMGSATRQGMLYHEIPFAGYSEVSVHRTLSKERVRLISNEIDLRGKNILDIGCNVGYFCFEFARLGATCWGIDYDESAILIANSLKHIHQVEGVHFVKRIFCEETISYLLDQVDHFDVILLNSVNHWLLYDNLSSIRQVATLLNQLVSPEKQYIVYEPSSGRAYYPEELTHSAIERFFRLLGVSSYHRIGSFLASNAKAEREIWLGQRDLFAIVHELDGLLEHQAPTIDHEMGSAVVIHTKRDKVCLRYDQLFIKTVMTANSQLNFLLRNELAVARKLSTYAAYMPVLILGTEFRGRVYLVYEWIEHHLLADSFVPQSDLAWLTRELRHLLHTLAWLGLAHNDLHPYNIFFDPKNKAILLFDYEHSGPGFSLVNRPESPNQLLLTPPATVEEEQLLTEQLSKLGGTTWRSPYGPGCYENDYYAVNKIIYDIKNRRKHLSWMRKALKRRLRQGIAQNKVGRILLRWRRKSTKLTNFLKHSFR